MVLLLEVAVVLLLPPPAGDTGPDVITSGSATLTVDAANTAVVLNVCSSCAEAATTAIDAAAGPDGATTDPATLAVDAADAAAVLNVCSGCAEAATTAIDAAGWFSFPTGSATESSRDALIALANSIAFACRERNCSLSATDANLDITFALRAGVRRTPRTLREPLPRIATDLNCLDAPVMCVRVHACAVRAVRAW